MTTSLLRTTLLVAVALLAIWNWRLATVDFTANPALPAQIGAGAPAEPRPHALVKTVNAAIEPGAALARPVFWADRRGTAASAPETTGDVAVAREAAAPRWRLAGSQSSPSGAPRALIVTDAEPSGRWLDVGTVYDGWRLLSVEPHHVNIESGGRRLQIEMFGPAQEELSTSDSTVHR